VNIPGRVSDGLEAVDRIIAMRYTLRKFNNVRSTKNERAPSHPIPWGYMSFCFLAIAFPTKRLSMKAGLASLTRLPLYAAAVVGAVDRELTKENHTAKGHDTIQ
jgi:hypothetical protein